MINSLKITGLLLCVFLHTTYAQNPNVIDKCSDSNSDYQLISKNKVKTVTNYEQPKKGKAPKKLKSKVWYSPAGCLIKSFMHTPGNTAGGNYTMIISEYNTNGYRTKFENYMFNSDSVPLLMNSEIVVFDSASRLKEKITKQYISKDLTESITENYDYDEPGFYTKVTQTTKKNSTYPYTTSIYKYKSASSTTPDYRDVTTYSKENSYSRGVSDNSTFDEYTTVENGKTISHIKTTYEKDNYGNLKKESQKDLISGKILKETVHANSHESTTTEYDNEGKKTNTYENHLPYGLSPEEHQEIEGYSYPLNTKKDTAQLKNGNLKITIYEKVYSGGKTEDKISQSLEYNRNMLLLKQDVEFLDVITLYEYEYY